MSAVAGSASLAWEQLKPSTRHLLAGKLDKLYGHTRAAAAFNALVEDKQQALLLLLRRFLELDLWPHVRQIENVYGEGGVGMNFAAWPSFHETLRWHRDISPRLAKRPGFEGGFRELRVQHGGLHILYRGRGTEQRWDAHFDCYNPLFSLANTARHVWHEVIKKQPPSWHQVHGWLHQ